MSILKSYSELVSLPISRRHFITAGAAVVGTQTFAAGSKSLPATGYSALVVGKGAAADLVTRVWKTQPAVRQLHRAQGLHESLQAIGVYRPELIVFTDPITAADSLDNVRPQGLRGVCLDLSRASSHDLEECNRSSQNTHLKWAVMDPLRYSEAYPRLARLLESESLGRLLEMRCEIKVPTTSRLLPCCRQSIALAVGWGGLPRSCHARIYQGTKPLSDSLIDGLAETGASARDCSLHSSLALACGLTFHLDCSYATAPVNAFSKFTFLGTRGVAELCDRPQPSARWRAIASGPSSQSSSTWQSLNRPAPPADRPASDGTAAIAVLQDLISSIETDRQPLLSLRDACAADMFLNSSLNAHRLQQHIYFRPFGKPHALA